MTTTPRPVTDLDRPLVELDAAVRELAHRRSLAAGLLAEQRHQLLDLDADSSCSMPGACRYPYLNAGGAS